METAISDTLKSAVDTLTNNDSAEEVLNKLTFSIQNVTDHDGFTISIVGYIVVFIALVLLYVVFSNLTAFIQARIRKKLQVKGQIQTNGKKNLAISGEIAAAISMALQLHFAQIHDFENTVLTIKKVQRPYSPWSSKIYGLRTVLKK